MSDEMSVGLKRFLIAEDGAAAIEYGLVALLVALVIIAGLVAVGTNVAAMYGDVASKFPAPPV